MRLTYFPEQSVLLRINLGLACCKDIGWVKAWWKECPYSLTDFTLNFVDLRVNKTRTSVRSKTWNPPPEGSLKFNVNGSSIGNPSKSCIGGVLRDSTRRQRGVFSMSVGELRAFEAEVKAVHYALLFCQVNQIHHIIVESDSALVVGWITNKEHRPWKLLNNLISIDMLIEEVDCVGVFHIFRESDHLADYLAKSGRDRSSPIWSFL